MNSVNGLARAQRLMQKQVPCATAAGAPDAPVGGGANEQSRERPDTVRVN